MFWVIEQPPINLFLPLHKFSGGRFEGKVITDSRAKFGGAVDGGRAYGALNFKIGELRKILWTPPEFEGQNL